MHTQTHTHTHTHTHTNYAKSIEIRSFFWSVFSRIWIEYGDLRSKSRYSVQIRGNMDQKKLRIWTLFGQ